MNVFSGFDGMSCAQIALNKLGIKPDKYYSSEVDKYAIQVTQANYPDTVQMGDITKWREWDIDWSSIDLIVGGSPCQGFSFAGKQLAFNDPRSALFFVWLDILNHIKSVNPNVKFMLENVKMKKEYLDVISGQLGVEPVLINSALVSAQNRQRYYWANWQIEQPEDKGILLADIIESGLVDRSKSYCIDANYWKGTNIEQYIDKARRKIVLELPLAFTERRTEEAKRIRKEYQNKYGRDFSPRRAKELIARTDGKMNCLTATYSMKEHTLIDEKINYRKLTPIECERLQTVPDNYTNHISNTQRYKMLGNGETVDVIAHIFGTMQSAELLPIKAAQFDMFGDIL
jgi:DNA-cytosine methyltransferase